MFSVTVTINMPDKEVEETYNDVRSLDALAQAIKIVYPTATSVVMVFCV